MASASQERVILVERMNACMIGGAERMSLALLRHCVRNCHTHDKAAHIVDLQARQTVDYFTKGDALRLLNNKAEFLKSPSIVRAFPVPAEFGFLMCASAEEHCGHTLTPAAFHALLKTPSALEVYSRGVRVFMDMFGIPSVSQNPQEATTELLKSFASTKAPGSQYSVCALFYRVLASTYFLERPAFDAISAVFSRSAVKRLQTKYRKETCGLSRVIHYSQFMNELERLMVHYEQSEEALVPSSEEELESEGEHEEYSGEQDAEEEEDGNESDSSTHEQKSDFSDETLGTPEDEDEAAAQREDSDAEETTTSRAPEAPKLRTFPHVHS